MKDGRFEVDDLVVQTGSSDVMRVLETNRGMYDDEDQVHCALGNDDGDDWFGHTQLSLVPSVVNHGDTKAPELVTNTINNDEMVHEEVGVMMIRILRWMREQGVEDSIHLSIETEHYDGDESDIEFTAKIRFEEEIKSDNLFHAAQVAVNRHFENKELTPKAIKHYR